MKLSLVFFLLLDIPHLKGLQSIKEFEHILLRLTFPSSYNGYSKSCCKFYPGGCYHLLNSAGFICDFLKGRVTKTERDGWIEFKISNMRSVEGGYYRCFVEGTERYIYKDYYVEVSEVSVHHSQSPPSLTTTVKAPNTPETLPTSTEPALAQDHSDSPGVPWSFGLPVAITVSITVMILITSVICVICYRVKARRVDKNRETVCESLKQEAPETSNIIYSTVDFRAHQKQTVEVEAPDSTWGAEHDGMVEYSTLAIHQ